jgi:predicted CopG family antitoxin
MKSRRLLERGVFAIHSSCMATKTISLELDAYVKLKAAKQPGESFSDVVRRGVWTKGLLTGTALLQLMQHRGPLFTEEELDSIEVASWTESPPKDPWA